MSFNSLRKSVGNFIAGNPQTPANPENSTAEKKPDHSPLPVDPCPYSGKRFSYLIIDLDVTKTNVGLGLRHSSQLSDISTHYLSLMNYYQQGFVLEKVVEVPGVTKIGWNSRTSPFQAIFSREISGFGPSGPMPAWEMKVVKCTLHTQMSHGVIDASLGKKNDISDTTGITTTIYTLAGQGARLVGLEYSGEKITHGATGKLSGQKETLGVDVFFNLPHYHNPVSYVYQCINVPVRIAYLGPGKLIKVECNWKGMMDSYLQQGWKLVDIFWDQGKRSCGDFTLSGDHNSVWFFEKEASKLSDPLCVYEGFVIEYYHTVKVAWTGSKAKTDWGQLLTEMGTRGWELATIVETPEVKSIGLGNITFKILFFFQRKKMQQSMTTAPHQFQQPNQYSNQQPSNGYGYQQTPYPGYPTSYHQPSGQSNYGAQAMGHQHVVQHPHSGHPQMGHHSNSQMGHHSNSQMGHHSNSQMGLQRPHSQMRHYHPSQMGHVQNGRSVEHMGPYQNTGHPQQNIGHLQNGIRHQHMEHAQNGYYEHNEQSGSAPPPYAYPSAPPPYAYSMPPTSEQEGYSSGYYTPLAHYPPNGPK